MTIDREYRQDDRAGVGYCPKCGQEAGVLENGRLACPEHGWQWADWNPTEAPDDQSTPHIAG